MPTYRQIQDWVRDRYGFVPATCWIAHVKELNGLPVGRAWNRVGARAKPCPAEKRPIIEEAMRALGML